MTVIEKLSRRANDERLKRLLSYLAADSGNEQLRADAAEQALSIGEPEIAADLLGAIEGVPGERDSNLLGLAKIQLRQFDEAAKLFQALIDKGADDPAVKFNLAWSLSMGKDFKAALALLSPDVTKAIGQAAMLEVQLLHDEGEFERAADAAKTHLAAHPDDSGLAAAVSVLALDIEDLDLAKACAEKAGNHPDAITTLGTLALGQQQPTEAERLFDSALKANEGIPRAWIGRGLARLLEGDPRAAADIDRGADLFGDHIGSWIAAGWAHLMAGDIDAARQRFEKALAIDDAFAESHGSLAVIDALEGDKASASKRIEVAKRLDRQCFSSAFAQTLLTANAGRGEAARALFERILETPVNDRGDTAAAALSRMGLR